MKKAMTLLTVAILATAVMAADYTPMSEEDTSAALVRVSAEINGDLTLANDETIDNAVDAVVQVTFDDDAVVLGTVKIESENAAASVAAGDELQVIFAAQNDATQEVTYASVIVDLTDETDGTEDGSVIIKPIVAGTATVIATVDASGVTVVGDVAGTTIGGITQASLLDKAATEVVSGDYTFSGALTSSGTVVLTDVLAGASTTVTMTNAPAVISATAPVWVEITIGGEIYVIPAFQVDD